MKEDMGDQWATSDVAMPAAPEVSDWAAESIPVVPPAPTPSTFMPQATEDWTAAPTNDDWSAAAAAPPATQDWGGAVPQENWN